MLSSTRREFLQVSLVSAGLALTPISLAAFEPGYRRVGPMPERLMGCDPTNGSSWAFMCQVHTRWQGRRINRALCKEIARDFERPAMFGPADIRITVAEDDRMMTIEVVNPALRIAERAEFPLWEKTRC